MGTKQIPAAAVEPAGEAARAELKSVDTAPRFAEALASMLSEPGWQPLMSFFASATRRSSHLKSTRPAESVISQAA
jgi:hypothetical protein